MHRTFERVLVGNVFRGLGIRYLPTETLNVV